MLAETHVFKVVDGCSILADVYAPDRGDGPIPAIVWLHGGGMICGTRKMIDPRQVSKYVESGYAVFALDYRLAPETKMASIVEDLRDGFAWVRNFGAREFRIDPNRVAAVGMSAGGYLALVSGYSVSPRPKAVVSFYGYCDMRSDWCAKPDASRECAFSRNEAYNSVGEGVVSDGSEGRFPFYVYARRHGIWAQEICGSNPKLEPEKCVPFCPILNVTPEYPPTLLLHGDIDSDVPYEQSVMMADALTRAGVENELYTAKGREHGFDYVQDEIGVDGIDAVLRFLGRHLAG